MSLTAPLSAAHRSPDRLRDAMRRSLPFVAALCLHGGLVGLLVSSPPATLLAIRGDVQRLDVRFYTVSDATAQSDAQLVEPPLGENAADRIQDIPAPVEPDTAAEPSEPAPVQDPPEASPVPLEEPGPAASAEGLRSMTGEPRAASQRASGSGTSTQSGASSSDAPIVTTQQRPAPQRSAPPPPSFADILARAQTRLDPEDFRIVLSLGGVRETVRESFCLSSSAANLEAGDCPDGPNANSPRLARFGLQGLGEQAPEFLEDMDRMAFQLRQLGANPSQVERIMLALRESRREAINKPGVNRAMQRDLESRTDNLGNSLPRPD